MEWCLGDVEKKEKRVKKSKVMEWCAHANMHARCCALGNESAPEEEAYRPKPDEPVLTKVSEEKAKEKQNKTRVAIECQKQKYMALVPLALSYLCYQPLAGYSVSFECGHC